MYYILSYSNLYTHHIIINVVTIKSSNRRLRSSVFGALEDPVSEPCWSSVIRWNQGDLGGSMDWCVRNMEKNTGHNLFFPNSPKHRVSEVNVPLNQSIEWWVWMNEKTYINTKQQAWQICGLCMSLLCCLRKWNKASDANIEHWGIIGKSLDKTTRYHWVK